MSRRTFEDFPQGLVMEYGGYEMTREAIIAFARRYDPHDFHIDDEAGKRSLLGSLSASGWHTASALMRMHCDGWLLETDAVGSPGIPEVRWLKPVRPGDVLRVHATIVSARLSASRPGLGIVETSYRVLNQNGEEVMTLRGLLMARTREARNDMPPRALARKPRPQSEWRAPAAPTDAATLDGNDGMLSGCYEDVRIGQTYSTGAAHFPADEIVEFAKAFDPQFLHIDEEAAREGPYGALIASGWHTASAGMRCFVDLRDACRAQANKRGIREMPRGPSPGFRDLKWPRPVLAGDTLSYSLTPVEKRKSARPGWGVVFSRTQAINQFGETVFEYTSVSLWPLRDSA
ncbi:MAG: MaoC family dehydratase [Alphaproteobacteria bacterium]|nr:MaoC family dehydratase [Alphaproteobacteria bacterium]